MNEETLFDHVRQTPLAERAAILDRECAGNSELRLRVERLLAAHNTPETFLVSPVVEVSDDLGYSLGSKVTPTNRKAAEHDLTGTVLAGNYKLLTKIGEGGMGAVWLAQQMEPVKRKVAIKLIKPGMDSAQVLKRFETERQALAVMDHPNIAKVFDGGMTPEGRPFFVMELVKGVPITEYCDENKLTPRQRLELFIPVCQAIQHAHQKGVIHRDIKPSNVLIALYDEKPVPKVIDFGLAKATGQALTEQTLSTALGAIVGTPQYMSPEQATLNNLDIDTRSDVYSLGVLLYELLTGSPPFSKNELEKKGLLEILRSVREDEPPKPSTKLSSAEAKASISANRSTEPKKLTSLLRSDLDWILLKTLEKNRARRYETANGFAADLLRYLAGEPVIAHPPSAGYRLMKSLRKNRGPAIAAGIVVATLVVGIVGTSVGLIQANRARAEEAKQRQLAEDNAIEAYKNERAAEAATALAQQAQRQADIEKRTALKVASSSTLDQAQQICENGDVIRGLHLMVKALSPAIEGGDASLEDAVRSNIATWLPYAYRSQGFAISNEVHFSACFHPQGNIFVTGDNRGLIEFRDSRTCQKIRRDEKLAGCVMKLAWQPKGAILAILCRDGTLRLWDYDSPFASARVIRVCNAMNEVLRGGLSFSSDGSKLLVGAMGRSALLYEVATGEKIGEGFYHGSTHSDAVAISPDGTKAVIGTPDWSVRVYDLSSGKPLTNAIRTYGTNLCAGISPDGTKFFTGHHMDASLQVWDIHTGAAVGQRITPGGPVLSAAFSPDSQYILMGGWMSLTQIWDWKTGKSIGSPIPGQGYTTAFSPDGQSILISTPGGTGIWKLADRGLLWTSPRLPGSIHRFTIQQDSQEFAFSMANDFTRDSDSSQTNFIRRYRTTTGEPILPFLPSQKYGRSSISLQYSSDGKTLYCAEGNGLTLYDLQKGCETERMIPPTKPDEWAYSSDGRFMACAGDKLVVYDHLEKKWGDRIYPKRFGACTLNFIPGTHRAFECSHGDVLVWDLDQSAVEPRILINTGMNYVSHAVFRPDAKVIVVMDSNGQLNEFDVATGKPTGFSLGSMGSGWPPLYSPDGRWLYLRDQVGTVTWHPATRKKLGPYLATGNGSSRGITPDGMHLITIDDERRLQCWRVPKPVIGTPDDVQRMIVEHTGLGNPGGNQLKFVPPRLEGEKVAPLPPLPVSDFSEIHNAEMPALTKWFAEMPKNFRPMHLSVQEGSNGSRFDAIALDDGTAVPFEAHLALSARKGEVHQGEADKKAMGARGPYQKLIHAAHFIDNIYHVNNVWAEVTLYETIWKNRNTLEAGLQHLRSRKLRPVGILQYDDAVFVHGGPDDGHSWEFHVDLTAKQVKAKIEECKTRKWRPTMIHRHRKEADKFVLNLIDNPHGEVWEHESNLSTEDYAKKLAEFRARGLRPQYVQSWIVDNNALYNVLWVGGLKVETETNLFPK